MNVEDMPMLLKYGEAGRILGVHPKTINRLVREGVLTRVRYAHNAPNKVRKEDVLRLVNEGWKE